jgi:hypothetical protein
MGFTDFISDAFDWVKNGVSDVYNGTIKPVVVPIYNEIKPVVGDLYSGIVKPAIKTGGGLIQTGGQFVQGSSQNFLNLQKGLGDLVTNPLIIIGVLIAGVIIIPKIADKL